MSLFPSLLFSSLYICLFAFCLYVCLFVFVSVNIGVLFSFRWFAFLSLFYGKFVLVLGWLKKCCGTDEGLNDWYECEKHPHAQDIFNQA